MNPRTRIYFFGGVVLLTIAALLLSIVDHTKASEFRLVLLGVAGISGGAVLILLALGVLFVRNKIQLPTANATRTGTKRNVKRGKAVALLLGQSVALAALSTVLSALLLPMIYGGTRFELVLIQNAWLIGLVFFLIFLTLGYFAQASSSWRLG